MILKVLFFASCREAAGCDSIDLELASLSEDDRPPTETADSKWLLDFLQRKFPDLSPLLPSLSLAVNKVYTRGVVALKHDDEVALIPPIGGG